MGSRARLSNALVNMGYRVEYDRLRMMSTVIYVDTNGNEFSSEASDYDLDNTKGCMQRIIDDISRQTQKFYMIQRLEMMGYKVLQGSEYDIIRLTLENGRTFNTKHENLETSYNPYALEAIVARINQLIIKEL